MKMTRKLIPAFAMLLVSAAMLSTASFAWFASSTSVTANDMTVKVNTDVKLLEISADNGISYDTTADAANKTNDNLNLVHGKIDADTKTVTWYYGVSDDPTKYESAIAFQDVLESNLASGNYALVNEFLVRSHNDVTLTNLTVSDVALVEGTSTISDALRVLVVAKDSTDNVLGAQVWSIDGTSPITPDGADDTLADNDVNSATYLADTVTNTPIKLTVYVYYDGQVASTFTDNVSTGVAAQKISVSFKVDA